MADYFICPHCYSEVPQSAPSCPHCGADGETGWSTATAYDGIPLADDEPLDANIPEAYRDGRRPWSAYLAAALAFLMVASLLVSLGQIGFYLIILLAAVTVWYLWPRMQPVPTPPSNYELYQDLLRKAQGDDYLVERWISYEAARNPEGDERSWMEGAIYRWERDNR
jgi:hypothetical protein